MIDYEIFLGERCVGFAAGARALPRIGEEIAAGGGSGSWRVIQIVHTTDSPVVRLYVEKVKA